MLPRSAASESVSQAGIKTFAENQTLMTLRNCLLCSKLFFNMQCLSNISQCRWRWTSNGFNHNWNPVKMISMDAINLPRHGLSPWGVSSILCSWWTSWKSIYKAIVVFKAKPYSETSSQNYRVGLGFVCLLLSNIWDNLLERWQKYMQRHWLSITEVLIWRLNLCDTSCSWIWSPLRISWIDILVIFLVIKLCSCWLIVSQILQKGLECWGIWEGCNVLGPSLIEFGLRTDWKGKL